MADDDSCIESSEFCYRCLYCPCLSASIRAGLTSWFFAILHLAILLSLKIMQLAHYESAILYEVGCFAALIGLLLSLASIYGVYMRKEKYTLPLAFYLMMLTIVSFLGMVISPILAIMLDNSTLAFICLILVVINVLSLLSMPHVWYPWVDDDDDDETPQNTSCIQEPEIKFIKQPPSAPPYLGTLPAVEHEESALILPTLYPTEAELLMLDQ